MSNARRRIMSPSLPAAVADNNAYSFGVLDGQTLHVSGMVAFAPDGSYVGIDDVHAQSVQVFENLKAVVETAGGSLDDVVSTTTYLASAEHAAAVGEVRKHRLHRPGTTHIDGCGGAHGTRAVPRGSCRDRAHCQLRAARRRRRST